MELRIQSLISLALLLSIWLSPTLTAQDPSKPVAPSRPSDLTDEKNPLPTPATSVKGAIAGAMPQLIDQFAADARTLDYRFRVQSDPSREELHQRLLASWNERLAAIPFAKLHQDEKIDYLLLKNELQYRSGKRQREMNRDEQAAVLIPYLETVQQLCLTRENALPIDPEKQAAVYQELSQTIQAEIQRLNDDKNPAARKVAEPTVAIRASQIVRQLKGTLDECHRFYSGYDPMYSWWADRPYSQLTDLFTKHAAAISKKVAGLDEEDKDKIVGQPIGDMALNEELRYAMIPYSAEELVAIAEREFAWCEAESTRAAKDLGMDGDWKKALEHVKGLHVEPGDQPALIRELAWEAIHFLESNDLVTVPPLAANGWRMDMMSPEAQRVNPYFLGGEKIIVSFPTNTMTHAEKLMSLRSNNIHFSRATVQHELIPGHHLQHYMTARYRPYRQIFDTPFWVEGWALYWEMLLWDLGFPKTAENRVGMLFWRRHRCARIIFSLNYQLGRWPAEKCVQYLIDRVGHEPSAAAAEVRRSVMGGYGPLYQAAYMLGGLQIRALRRELVDTQKMSNRQFHDAVIQQNSIPIEMIRAALTEQNLTPEYRSQWRFAD